MSVGYTENIYLLKISIIKKFKFQLMGKTLECVKLLDDRQRNVHGRHLVLQNETNIGKLL